MDAALNIKILAYFRLYFHVSIFSLDLEFKKEQKN